MIKKTQKIFKRTVSKRGSKKEKYDFLNQTQYVQKDTWWLFWIIPIYSKETILKTEI